MSTGLSGASEVIGASDAHVVSGISDTRAREAEPPGAADRVTARPRLRLVWSAPGHSGAQEADPGAPTHRPDTPSGRLRLTRRGHAVLAALVILAVVALATVARMAGAGSAEASTRQLPARSPYSGMTQVVVRRGETLWSVAASAEPSGDPWAVVQEIIDVNALNGSQIQAGQLLWVPRG